MLLLYGADDDDGMSPVPDEGMPVESDSKVDEEVPMSQLLCVASVNVLEEITGLELALVDISIYKLGGRW